MRTSVKTVVPIVLATLILLFSACKKKDTSIGIFPTIELKTGGNYTSANDTIQSGDILIFGITGSNNGSRDNLAKLVILISLDGKEYETRKTVKIPEGQKQTYAEDHTFKLVTPGTQKIKFILTNTHGLETEKILTFTVLE